MLKKILLMIGFSSLLFSDNSVNHYLNEMNISCEKNICNGTNIEINKNFIIEKVNIKLKNNYKPSFKKKNYNLICNSSWDTISKSNKDKTVFHKNCLKKHEERDKLNVFKKILINNDTTLTNGKFDGGGFDTLSLVGNLPLISKISSSKKITISDILENNLKLSINNYVSDKNEYQYYIEIITSRINGLVKSYQEKPTEELQLELDFLKNLIVVLVNLNNHIKSNVNTANDIDISIRTIPGDTVFYILDAKIKNNIRTYNIKLKIKLTKFNKIKESIERISNPQILLILLIPSIDIESFEVRSDYTNFITIHNKLINNIEYQNSYNYIVQYLNILFDEVDSIDSDFAKSILSFSKNFIEMKNPINTFIIERNENDNSTLINEIIKITQSGTPDYEKLSKLFNFKSN